MITSKASAALPPWAVGSVNGPMTFSCSMIEPGQPWVMITGSALACRERTWMKWMSTPSISVTKFGSAFSRASQGRQSYWEPQWRASAWMVVSCTPWDASLTTSRSGQTVAFTRRRRSARAVSGKWIRNGRMAVASEVCVAVGMDLSCEADAGKAEAVIAAPTRPAAPIRVSRRLMRAGFERLALGFVCIGRLRVSGDLMPARRTAFH